MAAGNPIVKVYGDKTYHVQCYQGVHKNEYLVCEMMYGMENGTCQLFDDGLLKLSWEMKDGVRIGYLEVFDSGKAIKKTKWEYMFDRQDVRWILNSKSKRLMQICDALTGSTIYIGNMDVEENRNGFGIEYDKDSEKPVRAGVFRSDQLVRLLYRFLDENTMIEYDSSNSDDNDDLLARKPVYVGEYYLDEEQCFVQRHGKGKVIDRLTGVCMRESQWERGIEVKESQTQLVNGWYEGKTKSSQASRKQCHAFIRLSKLEEDWKIQEEKRLERERYEQEEFEEIERLKQHIILICGVETDSQSLIFTQDIESIEIGSNMYNEQYHTQFKVSNFPRLTSISIGRNSFVHVCRFDLSHLPALEEVDIQPDCFCTVEKSITKKEGRELEIEDCPALKSLVCGDFAFGDYYTMSIKNVKSLTNLTFGKGAFYYASTCSLTSRK